VLGIFFSALQVILVLGPFFLLGGEPVVKTRPYPHLRRWKLLSGPPLTPCRCLHRTFVYKQTTGVFFRIADLFSLRAGVYIERSFTNKLRVPFPCSGPHFPPPCRVLHSVPMFVSSVFCLQTNHECFSHIADLFLPPCRCLHRAFVYQQTTSYLVLMFTNSATFTSSVCLQTDSGYFYA